MQTRTIRKMQSEEFSTYYERITHDFPKNEYAPFEAMKRQVSLGLQEGWVYEQGASGLAYAFCAAPHPNDCVLLSFIAVDRSNRGKGLGSALIAALHRQYAQKHVMLAEVEKPELAASEQERLLRESRIAFYRKAGYRQIPGIEYTIWGVPMHLMAHPIKADWSWIVQRVAQIMYEINESLMGKPYMHQMKFRYVGDGAHGST